MTAVDDIESFFAGGAKTAKFEDKAYGSVIGGKIVADPVMRQQRDYETDELMVYPDGNPVMQTLVTVQALPATEEDDGQRTFYIRGQLKSAVSEALRKAGARKPERGGSLWVKYLSDEPVTLKNGKRGNDKKIHAAKYEPPAAAAVAGFFDDTQAQNGEDSPACPPGFSPLKWAAMSPAQQREMRGALRPAAAQAAAGGGSAPGLPTGSSRFDNDEPPF